MMELKFFLSLIFIAKVLAIENKVRITKNFMQDVLRKYKNDPTISVINMFDSAAAKPGENYATFVHRVQVKFSRNSGLQEEGTTIIVKLPAADEEGDGLFSTEIQIMSTVLKKMSQSLHNELLHTPVLLDSRNEVPSYIVLEDLKLLGYREKDRQAGMGWEHSKLAIDGLARFHAASVAVHLKEPKIITKWWRGVIDTLDESYVRDRTQTLANLMQNWGGVSQQYAAQMSRISETLYDKALAASKPKPNGFNLLVHGDYTSRNMLFKYNDDCSKHPIDHMMLDFQFCQYTSPTVDLWYMFATSVLEDVTRKQVQELVTKYHRKLETTMTAIGVEKKPITLQQLQNDMQDHAILYLFYTIFILPWNLIEASRIKQIGELFADIQASPEIFYNTKFRRVLESRLEFFHESNLLGL